MVSIDIKYSRMLQSCTPCPGREEGYLAKALQPDLKVMVWNVGCIARRRSAIDQRLCFRKPDRIPDDLRSSRACFYVFRFLLVNECDCLLFRRSFGRKSLKWYHRLFALHSPSLVRGFCRQICRKLIGRATAECVPN